MFEGAKAFNIDISGWNVSGVNNFHRMFFGAVGFTFSLCSWTLSCTANKEFDNNSLKSAVDDPITSLVLYNYGTINSWNVAKVTSMYELFQFKYSFNGNISKWDVSRVTDTFRMFRFAESFNQDISAWNTEKVTRMDWMFADAKSFQQNLCPWVTNNPHYPNNIDTWRMFFLSGCPNTYEPTNLNACFTC